MTLSRYAPLLALVLFFPSDCGNEKGTSPVPPNQAGSVVMVSWDNVWEQTACKSTPPTQCLGSSGFQIKSDGTYQVGPASDGTTRSGTLSEEELQLVRDDAAQIIDEDLSGIMACQEDGAPLGVKDSVTITVNQHAHPIYEESSLALLGSDCTVGDPARAHKLHSDLNALLHKYYPVPFPG